MLTAQRRQARAELAARQADARVTLDWTRIRAPGDGMLGARAVRVGTLVSPGTAVVAITPLEGVRALTCRLADEGTGSGDDRGCGDGLAPTQVRGRT